MLLGAIDVTDDTKMMSKALIEEMAASSESLTSIMESKHGRTVRFALLSSCGWPSRSYNLSVLHEHCSMLMLICLLSLDFPSHT